MIELKEYCGFSNSVVVNGSPVSIKEAEENQKQNIELDNDVTIVEIEAIHSAPFSTRNYTRYMEECLKNSTSLWTTPYHRPVIKHHNEKNGEIIGRVLSATYSDKSSVEGSGAQILTVAIPKKDAAEDIHNGLLETTSIGALGIDVRCSICGQNIAEEGKCEHERGQVYDGKTCYWDVYKIEPKEISYVVVPSDPFSKNKKVYMASEVIPNLNGKKEVKENFASNNKTVPIKEEQDGGNNPLNEEEVKQLQDKIKELTDKVKELQDLVDAKDADIKANKADIETKDAAIQDLTVKVDNATTAQATAESQAIEAKESYRSQLSDTFNYVRTILGKQPLEESMLAKRSDESLLDAIVDMKEEYNQCNPEPVIDPTLTDTDDVKNKKVNMKESADNDKDLDLQKEFANMISDLI